MNTQPKILFIRQDKSSLRKVEQCLGEGYKFASTEQPAAILERAKSERPQVVVFDEKVMGNLVRDSFPADLFNQLFSLDRHIKVLFSSRVPSRREACEALSRGAFDFFDADDPEDFRAVVRRALHARGLEEENEALQALLQKSVDNDQLLGSSPGMIQVNEAVRRVSASDMPVLILGEGGSGKELVARIIHRRSLRRDKPFIPVCVGAIPEALMDGELFGHEKSIQNGAVVRRRGKLALADGGTIFLDGIGDFSPLHQGKLLRFLLERTSESPGAEGSAGADVRVLASSEKSLSLLTANGALQEDLLRFVCGCTITLPPLRERGEDIMVLAQFFLHRCAREIDRDVENFTQEALMAMQRYSWPGNVRELENRVKRAVIIARGPLVGLSDLGLNGGVSAQGLSLKEARRELDMKFIRQALQKTGGNISRAAKELGITRVCLHDLLNKYSLR